MSKRSNNTTVLSDDEAGPSQQYSKRSRQDDRLKRPDPPVSPHPSVASATSSTFRSASRSGKVIKMRLRNFMCHDNLVIEFNNRINILIGNNGSGKSAVLTALVIGFGCKSSVSSRSTNLTQLIKRGETSATIEIYLSNDGYESYDKDVYGECIIVTRTLSASGSGTYKLKNEYGNVISTKRADLDKIIWFFNIQVDNPVCVLNQDAARSFLKNTDPKSNYKLFLKATQIETIIGKLLDCVDIANSMVPALKLNKKLLAQITAEVDEIKDKYNRLLSADVIKLERKRFKNELNWILVINQECLLENINKEILTVEKKLLALQAEDSNKEIYERHAHNRLNEYSQLKIKNAEQLKEAQEKIETHRNILRMKTDEFNVTDRNYQKQTKRLKIMERDISTIQNEVDTRSTTVQATQNLRSDNEEKKLSIQKRLSDAEVIFDNTGRDIQLFSNSKMDLEEKLNDKKSERQRCTQNTGRIQQEISAIGNNKRNRLLVHGPEMPNLIAAINQNKAKFSQFPRGPLEQYIEVASTKWRGPIEDIIASLLTAFVVNNAKDKVLLSQLIERECPNKRISIITTTFTNKVYDVSRHKVQPVRDTYCALDLINVSDPVVMNCLIDYCQLEGILLTEKQDLAVHLTKDEQNVPKSLSKIILLKPYTEMYPAPNYRIYSNNVRPVKYLQVNVEQRISQLKQELGDLQNKSKSYEAEIIDLERRLKDSCQELYKKEQSQRKLEECMIRLRKDLSELQNYEYPVETEVAVLVDELTQVKQSKLEIEDMINKLSEKFNKEKKEIEVLEYNIKQLTTKIQNINEEARETEANIENEKQRMLELQSKSKFNEAEIKLIKTSITEFKKQLEEGCTKLQRLEGVAKNTGPRVQSKSDTDTITRKIKDLDMQIKSIYQSSGTIEDVKALFEAKKRQHDVLKDNTESLDQVLESKREANGIRFRNMQILRNVMGRRIQHSFKEIVKLRGFTGSIDIDPVNQTLDLIVVPRDRDIVNAVSSTNCLSGGERSYTTIAFLIALWSCIDHPFFFLDEYDVFTFKRANSIRFHNMKKMRQHMGVRIQHNFKGILKLRGFNGEIDIDPVNKTLNLTVIPRDKDVANAVSNTKCLSGGERSYTTIAFLISLWSCVDHPFFFLDEYDVFTDQVNRQYMTEMLLEVARKKPECQYTFLTPQDIKNFFKANDITKIHRLEDPER